jgi:hypothetical protein
MTSSLKLHKFLPFVVDACQGGLGLFEEQIQICGGHDRDFPFHLSAQNYVFDKVEHTIDSGLEIINVSGFWLIENSQRLIEAEVERLSTQKRRLHHIVFGRLIIRKLISCLLIFLIVRAF